jgi:hypothetical protein
MGQAAARIHRNPRLGLDPELVAGKGRSPEPGAGLAALALLVAVIAGERVAADAARRPGAGFTGRFRRQCDERGVTAFDALRAAPSCRAIRGRFPAVGFRPGGRGAGKPDVRQRNRKFIVAYRLRAQCHACER